MSLSRNDFEHYDHYRTPPSDLEVNRVLRITDREARAEYFIYWSDAGADLGGILYIYSDPVTGNMVSYRLRPDTAPVDRDGKPAKYLSPPKGKARRALYFTHGVGPMLGDVTVPILIVESEQSALAVTAAAERAGRRVLCVATGGVNAWVSDGRPLSDFDRIKWEDRSVIILFDSDAKDKIGVRAARRKLAGHLAALGAMVGIGDLSITGKNGPDDVLAELEDTVLWEVIQVAKLWPDVAIDEALKHLEELKAKKVASTDTVIYDHVPAIEAIAAVDDTAKRSMLITGLAGLRIGIDKRMIVEQVDDVRAHVWEERMHVREHVAHVEQSSVVLDPLELVNKLIDFYADRRSTPDGVPLIEALYCMNTYVYSVADTVPYLLYSSAMPQCGKTTSMDRHGAACCRSRKFLRPSPATIFRAIEQEHPTAIFDEARFLEDWKSERALEIRDLLDGGYKKGQQVPRCEEIDGKQSVRWYDVYCPKIIGKIGNFTGTILSRGIVIHLNMKHDLPQSYERLVASNAAPLRKLLEVYRTQCCKSLAEIYEQEWNGSAWPFLSGREYELWVPLLIHARLIANTCGDKGQEFENKAIAIAQRFTKSKAELVVADNRDTGLALEVLEALEVPLFTLEEATKLNPDWLKSDNNWIYPGSLTKDLLQKEVWGARLEKLKSDKARDIRVGHFLRGFQSESEHCRSGTRYRLLALAGSLLQHLPTGTMVQGEKYDIRAMIQRLSLSRDVASSHVTECPEDVASKATSYEDPVTSDSETSPESRTPGVSDDPPTNDGIASGHDGGNGPSHDGSAGYDVEDL